MVHRRNLGILLLRNKRRGEDGDVAPTHAQVDLRVALYGMALAANESNENKLMTTNAGRDTFATDELLSPRAPKETFEEICAIVKEKRARRQNKSQMVKLDNSFFQFTCTDTFNKSTFKKGHSTIYDRENIIDYDKVYQKQLVFNFAETRARKIKTNVAPISRSDVERDYRSEGAFMVCPQGCTLKYGVGTR